MAKVTAVRVGSKTYYRVSGKKGLYSASVLRSRGIRVPSSSSRSGTRRSSSGSSSSKPRVVRIVTLPSGTKVAQISYGGRIYNREIRAGTSIESLKKGVVSDVKRVRAAQAKRAEQQKQQQLSKQTEQQQTREQLISKYEKQPEPNFLTREGKAIYVAPPKRFETVSEAIKRRGYLPVHEEKLSPSTTYEYISEQIRRHPQETIIFPQPTVAETSLSGKDIGALEYYVQEKRLGRKEPSESFLYRKTKKELILQKTAEGKPLSEAVLETEKTSSLFGAMERKKIREKLASAYTIAGTEVLLKTKAEELQRKYDLEVQKKFEELQSKVLSGQMDVETAEKELKEFSEKKYRQTTKELERYYQGLTAKKKLRERYETELARIEEETGAGTWEGVKAAVEERIVGAALLAPVAAAGFAFAPVATTAVFGTAALASGVYGLTKVKEKKGKASRAEAIAGSAIDITAGLTMLGSLTPRVSKTFTTPRYTLKEVSKPEIIEISGKGRTVRLGRGKAVAEVKRFLGLRKERMPVEYRFAEVVRGKKGRGAMIFRSPTKKYTGFEVYRFSKVKKGIWETEGFYGVRVSKKGLLRETTVDEIGKLSGISFKAKQIEEVRKAYPILSEFTRGKVYSSKDIFSLEESIPLLRRIKEITRGKTKEYYKYIKEPKSFIGVEQAKEIPIRFTTERGGYRLDLRRYISELKGKSPAELTIKPETLIEIERPAKRVHSGRRSISEIFERIEKGKKEIKIPKKKTEEIGKELKSILKTRKGKELEGLLEGYLKPRLARIVELEKGVRIIPFFSLPRSKEFLIPSIKPTQLSFLITKPKVKAFEVPKISETVSIKPIQQQKTEVVATPTTSLEPEFTPPKEPSIHPAVPELPLLLPKIPKVGFFKTEPYVAAGRKRKYRYAPSVVAVGLGIKGRPKKTPLGYTGVEIRPLTNIGKKSKKKKKKVSLFSL